MFGRNQTAYALNSVGTFGTGGVSDFAATDLTAGVFLLATFLATTFSAAAFFATAPLLPAAFGLLALLTAPASGATTPAPPIKNLVRSFAAASHAGAGPRPLQVAPDLGSRYFADCGPLRGPL